MVCEMFENLTLFIYLGLIFFLEPKVSYKCITVWKLKLLKYPLIFNEVFTNIHKLWMTSLWNKNFFQCVLSISIRCSKPIMCTVTGFTVIDFYSRVHSVTDRCVYSLMKSQGSSQFELLAGFQERRRHDVMFLDHLILWLSESGVKIYLEQGGRVKVNK